MGVSITHSAWSFGLIMAGLNGFKLIGRIIIQSPKVCKRLINFLKMIPILVVSSLDHRLGNVMATSGNSFLHPLHRQLEILQSQIIDPNLTALFFPSLSNPDLVAEFGSCLYW